MSSKLQKQTVLPTRNELTHNDIANSRAAKGLSLSSILQGTSLCYGSSSLTLGRSKEIFR
jgi:hypothetical protein